MRDFLTSGGLSAVFLLVCCVGTWYAIGYRSWLLFGPRPPTERLDDHRILLRTLAMVAPLCGLLGTVSGMIETFDSLSTMTLFRRGGGIGAGISEALLSTQLGLLIAVPGLMAGSLLERRQRALEAHA